MKARAAQATSPPAVVSWMVKVVMSSWRDASPAEVTAYLPPDLNAVVGALTPGQRTPAFLMGTSWDRHSWYLRLPGPKGAPWSGVVRIECPATLPVDEVTRLAGLSQRCLGRFASAAYKDSRAPQNLYPIAGLERELRRRLGDQRLLYRALREAARGR